MQKVANFINFFSALGAQAALDGNQPHIKTAFLKRLIPKSRGGRVALGLGALGAGVAGMRASREEPSTLDNMLDGGKEMLSDMSPEEIMGYINLARSMQDPQAAMMGYSAPGAMDYAMPMDPQESMGYSADMSPEEYNQYLDYYGSQG
jgi:hypothetical protein